MVTLPTIPDGLVVNVIDEPSAAILDTRPVHSPDVDPEIVKYLPTITVLNAALLEAFEANIDVLENVISVAAVKIAL